MQVQRVLHHETEKMTLPPLKRPYITDLVFILLDAAAISSNHAASLSVFSPQTASLQAAAPKMSGQIIRSLIGKLERMFSSQKPGSA